MGVSNAWAGGGIYLKPNDNWKTDKARFAAYFFKSSNNSESQWMSMYASNKSGYYVCAIPDGFDMVILCRMNPNVSDNNWDNKWNQTGNLNVPSDGKIVCSINSGQWDCGNNVTWSAINWYIAGDFNGWNTTANKMPCDISIESGNHTMKIVSEYGDWFGNTGTMIRGNSSGWTMTYGENSNCTLTADVAGTYNFSCTGTKLTVTYPEECLLCGNFVDNWKTTYSIHNKSVTIKNLKAGTYEFKIHRYDATSAYWVSNDGTMTRENCSDWTMYDDVDKNCKITADFDGDYKFTYDRSTGKLSVTYPTAYKVTYGVGTNNGTASVTTEPNITSGSLALPSTSITFSKGATKEGYTWKGWYSKTDGTGTEWGDGTTYTSTDRTGDISVYACYDLKSYSITYNLNGGSGTMTPTSYNIETETFTLPTPTKTGYTFAGWHTKSDFSDAEVTQIAKGSTGNKTLYAQWECALTEIQIEGTYAITQGGTISLRVADNPNITPQTTYLWKRGNEEVGNERTLTISCELKNAGNYTCTVTNDHCSATNNFTVKYYHLKGFVEGDNNQDPDAWNTPHEFVWDGEGNKATLSIELKGHTTYQFKLNDGTSWYWNEGTITYNNRTNWEIEQQGYDTSDKQNTKITTTAPGIYTFTLNYDNAAKPQLSVIYPEEQIVYLKPGVWDVDGAKFTIYSWSSLEYTPSKFTQMELADCNGNVYKANIDPAHDWVSFIRAEHYVEKWEADIWDRSLDLKILNDPQFEILKWADLDETFGNKKKSSGKWSAYIPYYNISYNMNGHGTQISDACIQGGNSWSAPTDPTEVGYTFQGWRRPAATGDDKLYKLGSSGYTPTASETLTAQWDAIPKYTVSFSTGTDNPTQASITETKGGAGITLPTGPQPICTDWIFAGWWTEEVSSTNTSPGTLLKAGDNYNPTSNITLYAVYSTEEVGDAFTKYAKVTENLDDWSGKYLLSTGTYTATGEYDSNGTQGHLSRREYTPGNEEKVEWEFTLTKIGTTGYSILFPDGSWYLGCHTDTHFRRSVDNPANSSAYLWTPTIEGITNVNESSRKIADNGSTDFRPYSNYSLTAVVYLYKRVGGGSTTIYNSNPTCLVPVWNGADIDKTDFTVNCGERSPMEGANGAAKITFSKDKIYNFSSDITITASEGFLVSTSRTPNGNYKQSVFLSPLVGTDYPNTFNDKYVYVRAEAPTKSDSDLEGEITIKDSKGNTLQTIAVIADVSCAQYTLTFNDQGQTKTVEGFAGTTVEAPEPWAGICTEPIHYVFDGWAETPVANDTEEYEKIDFSTYTMPNNNTTVLYAVYRYAEDGSEPVNAFVKVTEALSDWTGDYVIVNETAKKAIGNAYASTNALTAVGVEFADNHQIQSPANNIIWQIRKSGENYTMFNESAGKYAYVSKDDPKGAELSTTTANNTTQDIQILFNDGTAKVSGVDINRSFYYYEASTEWRTYATDRYNTGALYRLFEKNLRYTSSLVCGEISVEEDNVVVTSTKDQKVKVYVPITLEYSNAASITGTSNNEAFTIVTKNDVAIGESNIEVHYKPTVYVDAENQEETATITLTTSNGATTTFNVTGRCLPESFVIAAKWGDNWYVLPADMSSETTAEGLLIEVDNPADPTKAIAAPNTTKYSLKSVHTSNQSADRFADYGERLVFVENVEEATPVAYKTLYNGGGNSGSNKTNIQVYAQYSGYQTTNPDRYEWVPTTTDLKDYTLTSAHVFTDEAARAISLDKHGVFGTLLQDKSYKGMVRLLPVDEFYTPTELQVVEWKANSVSIMYTGKGTKATTQVGNSESEVQLLSDDKIKIDHAVYRLSTTDLTTATNQVLTISIKDDAENTIGTLKMTVPAIVSSDVTSTNLVTSAEIAQATDIVVLDGATLTADDTKYTYNDVVVYPGGKLVIGESGQLGMYSLTLRLGSSWGAAKYEHKYPEFVLNTTTSQAYSNTSGKINLDYVTTKEQYYTFVAPFAVETKDIKYPVDIYGSNVEAANRGSFEFQYYDGEARARGEKGWKVVEEDPTNGATLNAHQGYTFLGMPKKVNGTRQKFGIHRIPMAVAAGTVMSHENTAQTTKVSAYPSEKNNNSGWNLIGNPYMATITGLTNEDIQVGKLVHTTDANDNWTGGWHWDEETVKNNQRFLVIPSDDGQSYEAVQASNATLPAFKNFFVQIGDKDATDLSIPRNTPQAQLLAPIRHTDEEVEHDIEMAIVLEKDEAHSDQMDFLINDIYTADFDYNADFTKMMNATDLNLYGVHPYDNLSFVAMDNNTARGSVAIGYQVPQAGEYILRMSDKPYVMFDKIEALYVTDHEMSPEVTTDIMSEPYRFTVANAETNHTRFTVSVILKTEEDDGGGDVGTGVDNTTNSNTPCKFIYQDKMYILLNGVIYDAMGKQVQTINK